MPEGERSRDEYTNAGSIFVYCTYEPSRESKFRPAEKHMTVNSNAYPANEKSAARV